MRSDGSLVDMALYKSEFTEFLENLRAERPHLDDDQRRGRALWWDRDPIDLERTRRDQQSRLPQPPYPYQSLDEADLERAASARSKPGGA